jgi:hypothetical protein
VRELCVCNLHASRNVLLLNVCVVSTGLITCVVGTQTMLLSWHLILVVAMPGAQCSLFRLVVDSKKMSAVAVSM